MENRILFIKKNGKKIATLNLTKGQKFYNEKIFIKDNKEYRIWDPYESKLGAAIMNGLEILPLAQNFNVLYVAPLDIATLSHISDIVGNNGRIIFPNTLDIKSQKILNKNHYRTNIVLQNNNLDKKNNIHGEFDLIYIDCIKYDLLDIAINEKKYLRNGGYVLIVLKLEYVQKGQKITIKEIIKKLQNDFILLQVINLADYVKEQFIILLRSDQS